MVIRLTCIHIATLFVEFSFLAISTRCYILFLNKWNYLDGTNNGENKQSSTNVKQTNRTTKNRLWSELSLS